jgi:uncharacterized protein involved in exopolysaccharide biosynthesis
VSSTTTDASMNADETIDIRALLATLWARRWWVIAIGFVCTLLTVIVAMAMTPIFRASTVLVPVSQERTGGIDAALGQLGGLAAMAGLNLGGGDMEREEALAVLRSREFTEAFIRDRNLMPILFDKKWDEKAQNWRADTKPPTPWQAYKFFNKKVRNVLHDKKTNLVTVQIEWKDGRLAAAWANELVQRLNAEMRGRAISHADASVGYLEKELESTSTVATRESINRLIESQIKQRMFANVTQEYAFRIVDRAMAPDPDDPIRPDKILMLASGMLVGGILGIVVALLLGAPKPKVERSTP